MQLTWLLAVEKTMTSWLHTWPLSLISVVLFAGLLAFVELGYRWARWEKRGEASKSKPTANGSARDYLMTAMLGLLALLLGFTFSLALARYETRRDLVAQEANALRSVWMHTQLLDADGRASVRPVLRDYILARLQWSESYAGRDQMEPTRTLQARLWTVVGSAVGEKSSSATVSGLLTAVKTSFDIVTTRVEARNANIPDRLLNVLLLYMVIAVLILGEVSATRDGLHRVSTGMLLFLITLTLLLILDLDRSTDTGAIMVSQDALTDLRTMLAR
jgi:hypothetical protein